MVGSTIFPFVETASTISGATYWYAGQGSMGFRVLLPIWRDWRLLSAYYTLEEICPAEEWILPVKTWRELLQDSNSHQVAPTLCFPIEDLSDLLIILWRMVNKIQYIQPTRCISSPAVEYSTVSILCLLFFSSLFQYNHHPILVEWWLHINKVVSVIDQKQSKTKQGLIHLLESYSPQYQNTL